MAKRQDFQGVLFDLIDEVVFERSPVIRGTYEQAMADAKALVGQYDGPRDAAECDCFVLIDGVIAYSEAEAA